MTDQSEYELGQRANGIWEVYWFVKMDSGKWNKRKRSLGTKDKREAHRLFADFTEVPDAKPSATLNVGEAIDAYIKRYADPRGQGKTARWKLKAPRAHFRLHSLMGVTDEAVERFTEKRLREVKPSTVRADLVQLQAALNWARRHMLKDPGTYTLTKPADGVSRDLWINEDQEAEIYEKMAGARIDVRLFFRMGLTYGARKRAMLELEFGSQVDWIKGWIDFNRPDARQTRKRRPAGPITPDLRPDLAARFNEVGGGCVLRGESTYRAYREFMEGIGYGWVTPHVLKHSCITLQCRAGVDEMTVAKVTNTTLATISRNYRHHSDDELIDAMTRRRSKA